MLAKNAAMICSCSFADNANLDAYRTSAVSTSSARNGGHGRRWSFEDAPVSPLPQGESGTRVQRLSEQEFEAPANRTASRASARSPGDLRLDKPDRVADGRQPGRDLVRNVDVEPLFARHGDLDEVEPVSSQVFGQPGVVGEQHFLDSEVKDEDIPDFCSYVGHHTLPKQALQASAKPSRGSPPATRIARAIATRCGTTLLWRMSRKDARRRGSRQLLVGGAEPAVIAAELAVSGLVVGGTSGGAHGRAETRGQPSGHLKGASHRALDIADQLAAAEGDIAVNVSPVSDRETDLALQSGR